jgi:hypothetical protein
MSCPIARHWTVAPIRGAKPLGLDILYGVDHLGTRETESYMEKLIFTRACLSNVRVIVVIMRVPLIESLCQAAIEWIPTRVPIVRHTWGLWPRPVKSGSKCHCFPRPWRLVKSTRYWKLLDGVTGYPGPSRVKQTGGEILPTHVYHNEEERLCRLLSGSVLFRLVVSPFQLGVVEPYPVQVYNSPVVYC